MPKKEDRKKASTKEFICVVCGRKSKVKISCCGKKMLSQERGSWDL